MTRGKRVRKVQSRTVETRTKILAAAAKEFSTKGFDGTSTRQIATAAGVPHTLLAYHFDSKEGLWKMVVTNIQDRLHVMLQSRMEALSDAESHVRLRVILEGFVDFSFENPEFHWIMSHEASREGDRVRWLIDHHVHSFFFAVGALVEDTQKSGHFVAGDPKHLIYLFIGCVTRIFMVKKEVEGIMNLSFDDPAFIKQHKELSLSLFFTTPAE